jgi:hypothetical protein
MLYRIAAVLLFIFAVMHTIGFLSLKPPTPEALAVRDGMTNVHFHLQGADLSYGGFYRGFGLAITANGLFIAFLAWQLAKHPNPAIGWGLVILQIAGLVLGLMYFAAGPALANLLTAACLSWATWKSQSSARISK